MNLVDHIFNTQRVKIPWRFYKGPFILLFSSLEIYTLMSMLEPEPRYMTALSSLQPIISK